MTIESEPATAAVRRPALVWVTFALLTLLALIGLSGVLLAVLASLYMTPVADALRSPTMTIALVVAVVVALLNLLIAIFVLRGAGWARQLGIGLSALNLVWSVLVLASGSGAPNVIGMAIQVVLLVLLTRRSVADWCY